MKSSTLLRAAAGLQVRAEWLEREDGEMAVDMATRPPLLAEGHVETLLAALNINVRAYQLSKRLVALPQDRLDALLTLAGVDRRLGGDRRAHAESVSSERRTGDRRRITEASFEQRVPQGKTHRLKKRES